VATTASATAVFGACLFQRLAEDLGLHRLAPKQALQLADLRLEFADAAGGHHVLVGPDRLQATLGHASPPRSPMRY
jgi:hypothetical protein